MDDVTLLSGIPDEPRFWLWPCDVAADAAEPMHGWQQARFVVRTVRGGKMRNAQRLFDEFAAAWLFPAYFGENWAAFDECLTDLGWLTAGAGYVLVMTEPGEVLADDPADFTVLVKILADAVTAWATPVNIGEWWDRPAIPFNVVLATASKVTPAIADRWRQAGAQLSSLGSSASY